MFRNLPIETLHQLLICDPVAGTLTWRPRAPEMFTASPKRTREHQANSWNTKNAGKPALNYTGVNGYKVGKILGIEFRAHRVIFAMTTGAWPESGLDHDQGETADNRFERLNPATQAQNSKNQKRFKTNKSGVTGVCFQKETGKWRAYFVSDYKQRHLGLFDDKAAAIAARKAAEPEYGFHANHGR